MSRKFSYLGFAVVPLAFLIAVGFQNCAEPLGSSGDTSAKRTSTGTPGDLVIDEGVVGGLDGDVTYVTLKGAYWSADTTKNDFTITSNCTIIAGKGNSYQGEDPSAKGDVTRRQANLAISNAGKTQPMTCTFTVTRKADGSSDSRTVTGISIQIPVTNGSVTIDTSYAEVPTAGVTYVTLKGANWSGNEATHAFTATSSDCTITTGQYSYSGYDNNSPSNKSRRQVNLAISTAGKTEAFSCNFTVTRSSDNRQSVRQVSNIGVQVAANLSAPVIDEGYPGGAEGNVTYATFLGRFWSANNDTQDYAITSSDCQIVPSQQFSCTSCNLQSTDKSKRQANIAVSTAGKTGPLTCTFMVKRTSDGKTATRTIANLPLAAPAGGGGTTTAALGMDYAKFEVLDGNAAYVTLKGTNWSGNLSTNDFTVETTNCKKLATPHLGRDGGAPTDQTRRQVNIVVDATGKPSPFSCTFIVRRTSDGATIENTVTDILAPNIALTLEGYAGGSDGTVSYATLFGANWSGNPETHAFTVTSSNCTIVPNQTYSYEQYDSGTPDDKTRRQANVAVEDKGDETFSCEFTVHRTSDGAVKSISVPNM